MKRRVNWIALLAIALIAETDYLALPAAWRLALRAEETDAVRGQRVAQALGCFNCHGAEGRGNVPNPGSAYDTVPSFTEQTLMMFAKNDQELTEYIVDGAPQRRRRDPRYREQIDRQALRMPAFRGWISDRDLTALVAYLRVVSGLLQPPDGVVARGQQLARELGCFSCHGEMGMGGQPNPGSLKGYIPGFLGEDFRELVRSDDELLTWLRNGALPRVSEHLVGRYFFKRQRVRMPAFGPLVEDEKLQAVAAYVRWLAQGRWYRQPLVSSSADTALGASSAPG
jgi:mono/diheme cytochrome c family protein